MRLRTGNFEQVVSPGKNLDVIRQSVRELSGSEVQ